MNRRGEIAERAAVAEGERRLGDHLARVGGDDRAAEQTAAFVVHPRTLEVTWPLKRREIPRDDIQAVRVIDRPTLRREVGWGMRVGAGGLFGAFGYLWTTKRGLVRMFVSRTDRFVWIERKSERPWLITPDQPDAFVRALSIRG